ncbi:MAG TPA: hypothetical protein VEQ59_22230, partial [Polyangiaceae bacterium]|nr:hypothetical protein [Polyangiaceae bacterium]
ALSGAARAATSVGDCAAYEPTKPHVFITGSSAAQPFVLDLANAVADDMVIVFHSQGSCTGVGAIFESTPLPTGTDVGLIGTGSTCTAAANTLADLGLSDVFATSCDNVDEVPDGIADFQGPVQAMNFVVPAGADAGIKSISAEAAYLVFGFKPSSNDPATGKSYTEGTPWSADADIWMRGPGSGTQSLLGAAIHVPPGSWAQNSTPATGQTLKGSGDMVNKIGTATNLDTTIGILASNELDDHRDTIRGLAFQAYDQTCGWWPDSTAGSKDKLNVRTGKYAAWGPLHMYTNVKANKTPERDEVADVIAYINGDKLVGGDNPYAIIAKERDKNLIPQCAMQVSRASEIGELTSVNPTCSCFYDEVRGEHKDACVSCDDDNPCADSSLTCSYGFCEAI